jgi:hypothetical protein
VQHVEYVRKRAEGRQAISMKDLIRDVAGMVLGECCDKPWGVESVKFVIGFDRKGRVEDITHSTIPPEHLDALLERVREVAKPHGKRLRGMLATVIVGFRSPSRN